MAANVIGGCASADDAATPEVDESSLTPAADATVLDLEAAIDSTVRTRTAHFRHEVRLENGGESAVVIRVTGVLDMGAGNGYAQQFADSQLGAGGRPASDLVMIGEAWLIEGALVVQDAGEEPPPHSTQGGAGNLLGLHGVYVDVDPPDAIAEALRGELHDVSLTNVAGDRVFRGEREGDSYEVTLDDMGRLVRLDRRSLAGSQTTVASVELTDFGERIDYPAPSSN